MTTVPTPAAALQQFAELLVSTKHHDNMDDDDDDTETVMGQDLLAKGALCQLPHLSFDDNQDDACNAQFQQNANPNATDSDQPATTDASFLLQPHLLAAWLRLLLQARLKQYVTILARHGVAVAKETTSTDTDTTAATEQLSAAKTATTTTTTPETDGNFTHNNVLVVEQKLAALIEIGSNVLVNDDVALQLLVADKANAEGACAGTAPVDTTRTVPSKGHTHNDTTTRLPMTLGARIGVTVPSLHGTEHAVQTDAVLLVQNASIEGNLNAQGRLESVRIRVDTQSLLQQLIQHVGRVMTVVVDHVKAVICATSPTLDSDASMALLPEPAAVAQKENDAEQDPVGPQDQDEAQVTDHSNNNHIDNVDGKTSRIVSPDLYPGKRCIDDVDSFRLDDSDYENDSQDKDDERKDNDEDENDVQELSPQSCANIVDFVIGELNHDVIQRCVSFSGTDQPPAKRCKTILG